jgi:hypothetical protein
LNAPALAALSVGFGVLLSSGSLAAEAELEIPEEFRDGVRLASLRGRALQVSDVAAALATDEMARQKVLKRDKRIRGWLTGAADSAGVVAVDFIGEDAGQFAVMYRLQVPADRGRPAFEKLLAPASLTDGQAALWRARQSASEALNKRSDLCSERYNTVVVPPDETGHILVYLLAATTRDDEVVAGGHFRYEFSGDGQTLLAQRGFTKSCFTLKVPNAGSDSKVASLFMTHLLDPIPTDIHVFLSLLHGQGLFVGTEQFFWSVDGDNIRLVERRQ